MNVEEAQAQVETHRPVKTRTGRVCVVCIGLPRWPCDPTREAQAVLAGAEQGSTVEVVDEPEPGIADPTENLMQSTGRTYDERRADALRLADGLDECARLGLDPAQQAKAIRNSWAYADRHWRPEPTDEQVAAYRDHELEQGRDITEEWARQALRG